MRRPSVSRATPKPAPARTTWRRCSTGSLRPCKTTRTKRRTDMPKRTDIKTVLIIGAGPIVIGQACEFDYSGAQARKALRDEGYRVVRVNINPAKIGREALRERGCQ